MKISSVKVTRVASPDRPIMNSTTAHATHFVRTITEIETSDGHRGISEVGRRHAENIEAAAPFFWAAIRSSLSISAGISRTTRPLRLLRSPAWI